MELDRKWREALDGTTFSSSETFVFDDQTDLLRMDYLAQAVRGKRVVHVGCVDHLPLLREKIRTNQWLHQALCESAERCLGVDVNATGIAALQELGWSDVTVGDITQPSTFLADDDAWDLLVLGEILEHVDNPVDFLSSIRSGWNGRCDRMIITVPNAFGWSTLKGAVRSREEVNTDHRFWFTPFTAAKVATRAGWIVEDISMCESFPNPTGGPVHKRLKRAALARWLTRNPLNRTSIVLLLHSPSD